MNRQVRQKTVLRFGAVVYELFVDDVPTATRSTPFTEREMLEVARIGPPVDPLAVKPAPDRRLVPDVPIDDPRRRWSWRTDVGRTFDAVRWRMARDGLQPKVVRLPTLIVDVVQPVAKGK